MPVDEEDEDEDDEGDDDGQQQQWKLKKPKKRKNDCKEVVSLVFHFLRCVSDVCACFILTTSTKDVTFSLSSVCLSVHPLVCRHDYTKSSQTVFMHYCGGKNPSNFEINPAQNGQLVAILDYCY